MLFVDILFRFVKQTINCIFLVFFISLIVLYVYVPFMSLIINYVGSAVLLVFIAWNMALHLGTYLIGPFCRVSPKNKVVVVTGCDRGFGLLIALTLLRAGYLVCAGCLNTKSKGADELRKEADKLGDHCLRIISLDVTCQTSVDKFVSGVKLFMQKHQNYRLWALINNAGVARIGLFEWGKQNHHYEQLFAVNVFGLVRMTRALLPLMRSTFDQKNSEKFRVVNINSFLSRITMQPIGAYCASKHASRSLTEGLKLELEDLNGTAVSVEPNFFATEICDQQNNMTELLNQWADTPTEVKQWYKKHGLFSKWTTTINAKAFRSLIDSNPQMVADAVERAVTEQQPPGYILVASWYHKILILVLNWLPRDWQDIFVGFFVSRTQKCT